ncbi:23S rRNA (guanosine(2251)-2'-O)-methyltransferase RlmB [Parapedobacter sp. ISTM3]|uniref:23S rRNA (Guanosine2251-2'-O)-methyltransferase n=1 Tax=Parapedobacter luteus TaxID=623280 RepID=A0A1T5AXH8_9SPHI|nr:MULTISPECIES: 23S rRNA (guanosine(2251)-2'-O)-methyltransferase RlmB [Parapedobacter]MBK1440340.1 23S rRNA (guanosine(2251)-2'-O)-methyltransferase RlmB [Parapedobacter sp. ISTM3]SKB39708.1 23S rRNA (guanosine2251-2'-O)-methyltransferase [Parapedobacter luteus]
MQYQQWRGSGNEKRETNQHIYGIRAVIEAIDSGKEIESLFVQRGLGGALFLELKQVLKQQGISYQQVPVEKLNRMTRKNHQGVIAVISPITYQRTEDVVPMIYEKGEVPLLIILDGITDVRNLGAIARTAACTGVHAFIVPKKGSAEINPDAIKTSAGALYKINVCREDSLAKTVRFLQESGIQVVACTEKTDSDLYQFDYSVPTALVLGSEEHGISDDLLRVVDHLAKIPMVGTIASLNVSVSAGVALYEVIRQRRAT